jgi:hypothetical protein
MSHHSRHEHSQALSQRGPQESPKVLAYQLWEQAGRPEGQAARFWKEAEDQIKGLHRPQETSSH